MGSNGNILTKLVTDLRSRKGIHWDLSFLFTQPGVPDFSVKGSLDILYPGDVLFTTESSEGLITAAKSDKRGFTRINFPRGEAMVTPMRSSRSRLSRCLAQTSMFDAGLADLLAGLVPYGGDISLTRPIATIDINGISCAGYIVDIGSHTPMPSSVSIYISQSDASLLRYVTDHPSIKGAQRMVTFSVPKDLRVLTPNQKVTEKGLQTLIAEPEFGGGVTIGKLAPPLVGTTLGGKYFDLDKQTTAKAHVIHFWSLGDQPSCEQVLDIKRATARFPTGLINVISICLDQVINTQRVKAVWARLGVTWPTLIDPLGPDSDAARTWRSDAPGGLVVLTRSLHVQSIGPRSTDITDAISIALRSK